jgi:uncharacterized delta-60 repeat protein
LPRPCTCRAGWFKTNLAPRADNANAIAIQADGKIVAAGDINFARWALVRYRPDGRLDPSFGGDGKVTTNFGGRFAGMSDIAIQADGKIVAAGGSHVGPPGPGTGVFTLARYNADGTHDSMFGTGGAVRTDFLGDGDDRASSVSIQADGRIVAAGFATSDENSTRSFALARYNTDGSLDATFGDARRVLTDFPGFDAAVLSAMASQNDGRLVVVGTVESGGDPETLRSALARYNPNGTRDSSFSGDGRLTCRRCPSFDVALQTNGKIVVVGGCGGGRFGLTRRNIDGTLDPTFGGHGKVTTRFAAARSFATASAVVIQPGGKIVAVGTAFINSRSARFARARYNVGGALDSTFSRDGKVTTRITRRAVASDAALQANGRIVATGSGRGLGGRFVLARYRGG